MSGRLGKFLIYVVVGTVDRRSAYPHTFDQSSYPVPVTTNDVCGFVRCRISVGEPCVTIDYNLYIESMSSRDGSNTIVLPFSYRTICLA
jgi:hypothetical protein